MESLGQTPLSRDMQVRVDNYITANNITDQEEILNAYELAYKKDKYETITKQKDQEMFNMAATMSNDPQYTVMKNKYNMAKTIRDQANSQGYDPGALADMSDDDIISMSQDGMDTNGKGAIANYLGGGAGNTTAAQVANNISNPQNDRSKLAGDIIGGVGGVTNTIGSTVGQAVGGAIAQVPQTATNILDTAANIGNEVVGKTANWAAKGLVNAVTGGSGDGMDSTWDTSKWVGTPVTERLQKNGGLVKTDTQGNPILDKDGKMQLKEPALAGKILTQDIAPYFVGGGVSQGLKTATKGEKILNKAGNFLKLGTQAVAVPAATREEMPTPTDVVIGLGTIGGLGAAGSVGGRLLEKIKGTPLEQVFNNAFPSISKKSNTKLASGKSTRATDVAEYDKAVETIPVIQKYITDFSNDASGKIVDIKNIGDLTHTDIIHGGENVLSKIGSQIEELVNKGNYAKVNQSLSSEMNNLKSSIQSKVDELKKYTDDASNEERRALSNHVEILNTLEKKGISAKNIENQSKSQYVRNEDTNVSKKLDKQFNMDLKVALNKGLEKSGEESIAPLNREYHLISNLMQKSADAVKGDTDSMISNVVKGGTITKVLNKAVSEDNKITPLKILTEIPLLASVFGKKTTSAELKTFLKRGSKALESGKLTIKKPNIPTGPGVSEITPEDIASYKGLETKRNFNKTTNPISTIIAKKGDEIIQQDKYGNPIKSSNIKGAKAVEPMKALPEPTNPEYLKAKQQSEELLNIYNNNPRNPTAYKNYIAAQKRLYELSKIDLSTNK